MPKAQVKSRIILTPDHAKRLMKALQENLQKYEAIYGPIQIQGGYEPFPSTPFGPPKVRHKKIPFENSRGIFFIITFPKLDPSLITFPKLDPSLIPSSKVATLEKLFANDETLEKLIE